MTTSPATTATKAEAAGPAPARTRLPRTARREQLLQAAQEVFVAQGYHAAAMDDIAERAGVSKPVLYQHFPGKLELYLALLDLHTDALMSDVRAALGSTTVNKLRVAALIDSYFRYVEDEGAAFRLVFESDLTNEPAVRERLDRVTQQCAEAIADVIQEDTGLPREESMLLGVAQAGMAQTTARYWVAGQGALPREEAAELISRLAWRGIRGFPRAGEAPAGTGATAPSGRG